MVATACYRLRPMAVGDIDEVAEIEREAFPTTWPPTAYRRELVENRLARYLVVVEQRRPAPPDPPQDPGQRPAQPSLAREPLWTRALRLLGHPTSFRGRTWGPLLGPQPPPPDARELVVGFVGLWLLPEEAHITTIAVRESYRRRGIGERLLIASIEIAQEMGQRVMTLECRVSNLAAIALYEKYNFRRVGLRPHYYSDTNEDALIMSTASMREAAFQALFDQRKAEHRRRCGPLYDLST